ncbi:26S proteasome regulatory subunit RPN13 [Cryptomeria japonica]|uniref:26S proteasome regulatory subunit RPN13 n=1 Tax=Cryptomeria japonica TaxID=3369 RepID=UPI0025ACEB76|nr:26S proteasome regulatory subunit RPN13 [Cryptomeria japonica]
MAASSAVELPLPLQEVLMEFRAGKMILEGTRVMPDTRKGLVRVAKGDEGLLHFQWLNRTTNVAELDQIIFPDEAVFEKVQESSGRVYILKFKDDDRKFFFWMQEPKADGDSHICDSVNYFINHPIEEVDEGETSTALQMSEASDGAIGFEVSSRDTNIEGSTLSNDALTGNVNPTAGPVQLSDLQRILSNLGQSEMSLAGVQDTGPSLGDILKPELVLPMVEHFPLEDRLTSYLPEGIWTREAFVELLQSPQFRQQVEAFNHVLRTGRVDLSQFGIDPQKYNFTVASFLEALDDAVAKNPETSSTVDSLPVSTEETRQEDNKDIDYNHQKQSSRRDSMDEGH